MSYISLLNEGQAGFNSSFVAATDFLTVGRALTNYGVLTPLDDATFSGANGINATSLTPWVANLIRPKSRIRIF